MNKKREKRLAALGILSWDQIMEWLREFNQLQPDVPNDLAGAQDPTGCYSSPATQGTR